MNYYLELINLYSEYIIIGLGIFTILLFVLLIIVNIKYSKLNKKYKRFMEGEKGESLEKIVLDKFEEINEIKKGIETINTHLGKVDEILTVTFQRSAIVKYDAFEMGGKLSFALALLSEENNGFILNSMHSSSEGCYTYIKEIINGESFIQLSKEEKEALEEAKNKFKYL